MISSSPIPSVAIVGRANVGKSTLFNRFLESRKALVSSIAGTTRDRAEGLCIWRAQVTRVIDTGGTDIKHPDDIEAEILRQANVAMDEADIILLLVDAEVGLTDFDRQLAKRIEGLKKPFLIAANKADTSPSKTRLNDPWNWSLGTPLFVSAARGHGVGDLLDEVYAMLTAIKRPPQDIVEVVASRVMVIGKPNVGKSSLLNKVLKNERFIVSPVEHTTREPNDTTIEHKGRQYVFVDTAGIRRKIMPGQKKGLERQSVDKSLRSLKQTDVVLFVLDASARLGVQEKILAGQLAASNSGVIIVMNKWDLIEDKDTKTVNKFEADLRMVLTMLPYAPVLFVSAKTGLRTSNIFDMVDRVQRNRYAQLEDEALEDFLRRAISHHKPMKGMGTAPPKILGIKQVSTAPPAFELAIKSRQKKKLHESYVRYLQNRLHTEFKLVGTPIRIYVNPVQGGG